MTIHLSQIVLTNFTTAEVDSAFINYLNTTIYPEEGPFTDDPDDSGGATKFGITEDIARAHGYTGDMRDLPQDFATNVYRVDDWQGNGLDKLALISMPLALELLDLGINMGDRTADTFLQEMLQALGYYKMTIDGQIGPGTCAAVKAMLAVRGVDGLRVLYCGVRAYACVHYIDIANTVPKDEKFLFGWLVQRAFPPVQA